MSEEELKAQYEREKALYEQYSIEKADYDEKAKQGELSGLQKFGNIIDIPGSLVRTGVEAAISPDRDIIPSISGQIKKTIQSPMTAAQEAPAGTDVAKAAFPDFKEDSIPGKIAGFVTEAALDPTQWFSWAAPAKAAIRKPLINASERQAAKAISKYAGKADVINEGVDLEVIGARLVAEDLQGMTRNPVKLYETLSGTRHIEKKFPDSLNTLQIKRGQRQKGKIGEISDNISSAIELAEREYKIQPQVPANIMAKQLLEKAKVAMSKTSGETPDFRGIEKALNDALKPFEKSKLPDIPVEGVTKVPGTLDLETKVIGKIPGGRTEKPTTLSLKELHELRKNVGKLVADRAFYASPDQAMRTETEALRDLYMGLGDVIKKNLAGKKITIGKDTVDAGEYYEGQNNRLKAFLDLQSMLEFQPVKNLKEADIAAMMAGAGTQAGIWGTTSAAATMAGLPYNPALMGAAGAIFGAGKSVADSVKGSTPEYLTSILKQASKIAPAAPGLAKTGTILGLREGKFNPEMTKDLNMPGYDFSNTKPAFQGSPNPSKNFRTTQSVSGLDMTPMEVMKTRLPRSTKGLIENKDLVIAKLAINGVPPEMIDTITQALNDEPEALESLGPMVAMQFPNLFAKSKYNMFDGKILDPNERSKAADDTSKRDDLNSLQKAKIINELNKNGKWLGE